MTSPQNPVNPAQKTPRGLKLNWMNSEPKSERQFLDDGSIALTGNSSIALNQKFEDIPINVPQAPSCNVFIFSVTQDKEQHFKNYTIETGGYARKQGDPGRIPGDTEDMQKAQKYIERRREELRQLDKTTPRNLDVKGFLYGPYTEKNKPQNVATAEVGPQDGDGILAWQDKLLLSDDNTGKGGNFLMTTESLQPGTYYLVIRGFGENSGETNLKVTRQEQNAENDIQQMKDQIDKWGSVTQFGIRISKITGTADNPNQSAGTASKTDHGFDGYNGTWEVGNWGDTLKFTT